MQQPASALGRTEVTHLFPTCLWAHDIADAAHVKQQVLTALAELRRASPMQRDDRSAWQSRGDLYRQAAFQPLCEAILTASRSVVDYMRWRCERVEITDLWANVSWGSHFHRLHAHPNNFLSGVYYAQIPPGAGSIAFRDPRPQTQILAPAVSELTPVNRVHYPIQAEEGKLLLFPSWLEHVVQANNCNSERISFAFNVTLRGEIGSESGRVRL